MTARSSHRWRTGTAVLGLMSGTSADGVDAVLAWFQGKPSRPHWRILNSSFLPYPDDLRQQLIAAGQGQPMGSLSWLNLAEALTEHHAAAARQCDPQGLATLVGCHGQTVWHRPPEGSRRGASWQVLQAPLLAQLLQRPVISDFRAADLALGGQGAPLVPPADEALLGRLPGWRALLNLGGIANLTLVPPACGPDRFQSVQGWDCGPANTLLDLAVSRFSQGRAAQGNPDQQLIASWLEESYFQQPPPKSTGRELFGAADLDRRLAELEQAARLRGSELEPADALASLTALSASVVAQDLSRLATRPVELLVAGGGCRNRTLMAELGRRCRGTAVRPLADMGIADNQREALVFALLAWWHQQAHPGNAPSVTGARVRCRLGVRAEPAGPID
jgi:anhydro-N-acetylmuramic acid kinase